MVLSDMPGFETPAPEFETPASEIETPAPKESDANKNVIESAKELQSVMQGFKFTKCTVNINLSK